MEKSIGMNPTNSNTCPGCGGLPGLHPNNQCPNCYVKSTLTAPTNSFNEKLTLEAMELALAVGAQVTRDYEWKNGIYEGLSIENKKSVDEAVKSIRDLILSEIVGDDSVGMWNTLFPESVGSGEDVDELKNTYQNQLRAEQRNKILKEG